MNMAKMGIIPAHTYVHYFDGKDKLEYDNRICLACGNYPVSTVSTLSTLVMDILCRCMC